MAIITDQTTAKYMLQVFVAGMILRIPMWNPPTPDEIFDDDQTWLLPSEEYDVSADGKVEIRRGDYTNTIEMPGIRNYKDQSEQ